MLADSPADPVVTAVYCDASLACGRAADAVRAAQRFLRRGERDLEVLEFLVRSQWDLGLAEQCRKTCRRILRIDPNNYTALDYGLATSLDLGDLESSRDIIDLAMEHRSEDRHLMYQTAVARMMTGPDEWARERFEQFLADDPRDPGTYINLMRIHHLAEDFEQVRVLYWKAAANGIRHEDLEFNMGLALKAEDREREATRHFIRAIRNNPGLPDAHFHLGQILRNEGHPLFALRLLDRELRVDDTHPAVHAEMAWSAEDIGDYQAAVRMIEAAVERAPDWAVYEHSRSELLLKADPDSTEADAVARRAVEMDPSYAAGWQVLGRLAAERQDLAEAERCLAKAVDAADATAEDRGWLGLVMAELGRKDDALRLLESAARVHPSWRAVGEALGVLRGQPVPNRYEVCLTGRDAKDRTWYRILHVVASDEDEAGRNVLAPDGPGRRRELLEIRSLGYDVDHEPGIVWDSGPTDRRYPDPPPPERLSL
jgi:tetratricopeptide (TPR) repeat protein